MGLRCKMHDRVYPLAQLIHQYGVRNRALDQLDLVACTFEVFRVTGVGQRIQNNDASIRIALRHHVHKVRANETGTTGDEHSHGTHASWPRLGWLGSGWLRSGGERFCIRPRCGQGSQWPDLH